MRTELVSLEDLNGAHWRLSLDEDLDSEHPIVVLECRYSNGPLTIRGAGKDSRQALEDAVRTIGQDGYAVLADDWVHLAHVSSVPSDVGLQRPSKGVIKLDVKIAKAKLVALMAEHGAAPKPADLNEGISSMSTLPGIDSVVIDEPMPDGFVRVNLLEFLVRIESAEADLPTLGAMVRKLREAFYLLQDLSKAALAARGEIDHLTAPVHRTEEYAARIDMFDRWMRALGERAALFPVIQVPAAAMSSEPSPTRRPLSRDSAVSLAKTARNISLGLSDPGAASSYSVPSWVIDAIVEASR